MRRRLTAEMILQVGLLLACLGLVAFGLWSAPEQPVDAARPAAVNQPQAPAALAPFIPPPLESFAVVAARPVFAPTRRPPQMAPAPKPSVPAEPAPAAEAPPPPIDFALVGVVAREGTGIALVHLADGRTVQLREGERVGDWIIKWIGTESAVFRQGQHDVELVLDFKRPGSPAPSQGGN